MGMLQNLDRIRVHGQFRKMDRTPIIGGEVRFIPSVYVIDPDTREIVLPVEFVAPLDADGRLLGEDANGALPGDFGYQPTPGVLLPATDDPDLDPTGWTYLVVEQVEDVGRNRAPYHLELPHDLDGGTFDLAFVQPAVPESNGNVNYVSLATLTSMFAGTYVAIDAKGSASTSRPDYPPGANFVWINTPSRPDEIGPHDLWEDAQA